VNRLTATIVAGAVLLGSTSCQPIHTSTPVVVETVQSSIHVEKTSPPAPVVKLPRGTPSSLQVVNPDGTSVIAVDLFREGLDAKGLLNPNQDKGHEGQAAWFNAGTRATHPPGFPGSAVIAGHATKHGGAFHNLALVKVGAVITVVYSTGDRVKFTVTEFLQDLKTEVTDMKTDLGKRIWGMTGATVVWLISCDLGTDSVNGHRLGNIVIRGSELPTVGVSLP